MQQTEQQSPERALHSVSTLFQPEEIAKANNLRLVAKLKGFPYEAQVIRSLHLKIGDYSHD